jgi:hypothetical protein
MRIVLVKEEVNLPLDDKRKKCIALKSSLRL